MTELEEAQWLLMDAVMQWGYGFNKGKKTFFGTGGLSVLEDIFTYLKLPDPCPIELLTTDTIVIRWNYERNRRTRSV